MVWMETYILYCSVRLGVLVISVFSFVSFFVPSMIFVAMGLKALNPIIKLFTKDEYFKDNFVIKIIRDNIENDSSSLMFLMQFYSFAHMTASCLAFYGSLKVKKYFLLPFIFFEFCRVIFCFAFHVLLMTVSKNYVNLGILITATLAGGFLILFLGYNWAACVALYQIITLIKSERYKALYGDDPFKPLIPKTYNPLVTENVRVLITPSYQDIDEQKRRNAIVKAAYKNVLEQPEAVISVLTVNSSQYDTKSHKNNLRWKQSQWPTTTLKTPPNHHDNNYEVNYNHWQWSELAPGITARNKKNIYLDSKWN